jgi:hypothetical protein
VLPSRALAGAVVGQILPVIFVAGIVTAAVAFALEMRTPYESRRLIVLVPLVVMAAACVMAHFRLGPQIEAVREAIGGAVDALDASDPRRIRFGRLHAMSVMWMGVAMLGAASVLFSKFSNRTT